MNAINSRLTFLLPMIGLLATASFAGSYSHVVRGVRLASTDPERLEPFVIVHPIGYNGTGGVLNVGVCVQPGSEQLIPSLKEAIDVWNALEPRTGNCRNCVLWEEPEPQTGAYHAGSALLHELGHCALGLGHVNLIETRDPPASFRTGTS